MTGRDRTMLALLLTTGPRRCAAVETTLDERARVIGARICPSSPAPSAAFPGVWLCGEHERVWAAMAADHQQPSQQSQP